MTYCRHSILGASLAGLIALALAAPAHADPTAECNDDPALAGTTECGTNSDATGVNGTAVGQNSVAATRGTAVGASAGATGVQSIAIGGLNALNNRVTTAAGASSIAIGVGAQTTSAGVASIAIGPTATASGDGSTALGPVATASNVGSTAVGRLSNASGVGTTAVGNNAVASADGSIAIGQSSVANQANTVSVGNVGSERRIVNVSAGTAATDAVNLGQLNAVNSGLVSSIGLLQADTNLLFDLANRNRRDIRGANEGVAMALAMDTPNIPAGATFAMSGGVGYFNNRLALAAAISAAVGEMSSVSAGVGYGFNSKEVGARAGFQVAW
jgi:autotransporter adhesin